MEPEARDVYCHLTGAKVELRGLCTLSPHVQGGPFEGQQGGGAWLGGSPDGLTTLAGGVGGLLVMQSS